MHLFLLFTLLFLSLPGIAQRTYTTLQVPGRTEFCRIDTTAQSILPSGRYVTPAGQTIRIANDPFGLTLSPNGQRAVSLHDGILTVLDLVKLKGTRIPDYAGTIPAALKEGSFLGVAFASDNRTVFLSNGDKGRVLIFDTDQLRTTDSINLDGNGYTDSFTSDLLLNGNELLVLDRANFRLVRINLTTKQITASIPTGRQPFGLAISPDRRLAFVANVGLYAYPKVPGVTKTNKDTMALKFPPYAAHTKESAAGVEVEGRRIPGLGSPLADEAMSVWTVDLRTNKVISRFKTGVQIGEMIEEAEVVGGASPNSVVVGNRYAYVSNATNDNISVIDYKTKKLVGSIPLKVDPKLDRYRGLMPFGLALPLDATDNSEKTLYVALLAFNAVAVVDLPTRRVRGLIPTGWGPTRVKLSPDQKTLYILSARGYGAGPNGGQGFVKPPQGTYIGDIQLGTFQAVPVPDAAQLAIYTKQVLANTYQTVTVSDDGKNPLPVLPKSRQSPIKHIVYITKENRTYDEVLGQLPTGRGDSTLARFGVGVTIKSRLSTTRGTSGRTMDNQGDSVRITAADIMPNHRRIAQQFAFSDNFYCDSDASIHGHHWMLGTIPNEWVEANAASAGRLEPDSKAPGRRFPKASGAIDPEDYNEIGGLWEAFERANVSLYNFGQANEYAGAVEEWTTTSFGAAQSVVFPMPKAVFPHTSRDFAGYNTNVPDQYRMEQFEREFTAKWLKGKQRLPQFVTVQIPNDHGAGPRPTVGYPYLHSYMADNDLAVGRMLHFLSRTKYWKNMLVIITEDDPQGGVDHIDAHRSLLMMAGPYVKRGYVSHRHANFGSILKTMYNILGVPYVNQYDLTASLLQDYFTDKPDYRPYDIVFPDARIFDPQAAMKPYKKTIDWRTIQKGPQMDDRADQRAEHYRQQLLNP
ncbi:bifunctional YncE family protein/alkaline phosphatase family protein [Spirosoma flavum]|uniref:Bifunctional YncE family protein/alkaline phosphatase family protein n=1 Tax=Spirosoma flavum TaxID=2048557 RepID=A0ABW6ATS2_9BACT